MLHWLDLHHVGKFWVQNEKFTKNILALCRGGLFNISERLLLMLISYNVTTGLTTCSSLVTSPSVRYLWLFEDRLFLETLLWAVLKVMYSKMIYEVFVIFLCGTWKITLCVNVWRFEEDKIGRGEGNKERHWKQENGLQYLPKKWPVSRHDTKKASYTPVEIMKYFLAQTNHQIKC